MNEATGLSETERRRGLIVLLIAIFFTWGGFFAVIPLISVQYVDNLGWTAVIESIVLGDGGPRHVATLRALIEAGANVNLADRNGITPLALARGRGFREMVVMLERAGAR